jgi:RHH-type rel operon transcriptional repressor/antitoxin RelB
MLALRLPADVEEKLTQLANLTGRTKTYYATQAIIRQIQDLEDYYLAEKAWQEFVAGDKKTYTSDEVIAELGL